MKKIYVIDASVIIKYLLSAKKVTVSKVRRILSLCKKQKVKLYSTELLFLEVANGLRFSLEDRKVVLDSYSKFLDLLIESFDFTPPQYYQVLRLCCELDTTVYDTSYHYLAMILEGTFLTSDEEYFKKASVLEHIELI